MPEAIPDRRPIMSQWRRAGIFGKLVQDGADLAHVAQSGDQVVVPVVRHITIADPGIEAVRCLETGPRQPEIGSDLAGQARQEIRAADVWKHADSRQLGSASCRESVCQYVLLSVVAGSFKKKINIILNKIIHN